MDIINNIHRSILTLQKLGSNVENIKITTSPFTKAVIERDLCIFDPSEPINAKYLRMFGVEVSFDHFSNEIVIYDKERACMDDRFKVKLYPFWVKGGQYFR